MNDIVEERLLEPEIKAMVLNYLKDKRKLGEGTAIINEFTVDGYSRRVDLVLADRKHLIAFEIKSEADSLHRLDGQTKKYLEYFDKVIIVAASKHINKVMKTVPEHVAVWEVYDGRIKVKRRGRIIPIADKAKLVDLMKLNELLKLSNKLGLSIKLRNRRSVEEVLENTSLSVLREAALQCIKERFFMTYSLFWKQVSVNQILPEHIDLLSPYKERRQSQKVAKEKQEFFWNNWASSFDEDPYLIAMAQKENKQIFGITPKHIKHLITA